MIQPSFCPPLGGGHPLPRPEASRRGRGSLARLVAEADAEGSLESRMCAHPELRTGASLLVHGPRFHSTTFPASSMPLRLGFSVRRGYVPIAFSDSVFCSGCTSVGCRDGRSCGRSNCHSGVTALPLCQFHLTSCPVPPGRAAAKPTQSAHLIAVTTYGCAFVSAPGPIGTIHALRDK